MSAQKVSLSQALEKLGDNVEFQYLHSSMVNCKLKKKVTEITFVTEAFTPSDFVSNSGKLGIIVWVNK